MALDDVRITLKIPREVHAVATRLSKEAERSLNWQMIHLMKLGIAQVLAAESIAAERAKRE